MLVGRGPELERCLQLFRSGRPVAVVGEAGVGKTALLRAVAAHRGAASFEGGGLATLAWVTYLPLARATGIGAAGDDPADVARAVRERVGDGTLLLDDLHWTDATTLRVVGALAGTTPVLAGVRRPDDGADRALEALATAGFELVELGPLPSHDATALVEAHRPELGPASVATVVARAAGLPLLLEELSPDGSLDGSLRLSLAARLRALSPRAREAMALLALAGRPLAPELVAGADELAAAGLAAVTAEGAEVRHALLGEAAVDSLDPETQRRLHSYLAGVVVDAGEAARHHLAAGERDAAHAAAVHAAASSPSHARVEHLRVAALSAPADTALAHVLEACGALLDAGRASELEELLAGAIPRSDPERARLALMQAQSAFARRDQEAALRELELAATHAPSVGSGELDVLVALVRAEVHAHFGDTSAAAVAAADEALALARREGAHVGRALVLAAALHRGAADGEWESLLREAIAIEDDRTSFAAADTLVFALLTQGRPADALAAAEDARERTAASGRTTESLRFAMWCVAMLWYLGRPREAAEIADELHSLPLEPTDRADLEFYASQAWLDVGRDDDARAVLEPRAQNDAHTHFARGEALWGLADVELWSGRAQRAHELAEEYLRDYQRGSSFVSVIRGWAAADLGRDPGPEPSPSAVPLVQGAFPELRALAAAHRGDHAGAVALFDEAAELWKGRFARGSLRCRLGAAEAARRAGHADARERLEQLERDCGLAGYLHVEARVRRALRLAGERRSAPRRRAQHGLTEREQDVLLLVGKGLSNGEIATRLGLSRSTVERQLETACRKLGVRTRTQAAARIAS